MQSVPITTNVVRSNTTHGKEYAIQHYVIKFVSYLEQVGGFLRVKRVSPTNKTNCHDITEILLKVALNTTTHNPLQVQIQGRRTLHVPSPLKLEKYDLYA